WSRQMNPLLGKVALVTGASRGIGAATARALASAGADVYLAAEGSEDELRALSCELEQTTESKAGWGIHDLSVADQAYCMVDAAVSLHGRLDILVNNAGMRIRRPFGEFSAADFDQLIAVNLRAAFLAS